MRPHNPNEASGFDPSRCALRVFLRHRPAYFEPDSKREGTSASFDAQASHTRVATRHAAPTPCSQSGHLRRLELAQWRLLPERSIKRGGDHNLLVDMNCRCSAIFDGVATAGAKLWLLGGDFYDAMSR